MQGIAAVIGSRSGTPAADGAAGWAPQPGGLPALSAIGGFLQVLPASPWPRAFTVAAHTQLMPHCPCCLLRI